MSIAQLQDGQLLSREPARCFAKQVSLYILTYVSQGLKVKGLLAVPEGGGPWPAVIYCRGGIKRVGMVRKRRIISMAKRGFVVFAPYYRGNEGGEGHEDFAGEDRFDLFHAIPLVQSLEEVVPGPVSLIGFSRGAVMAMRAARECSGVGAVVVWSGVSDMLDTYEQRVDLRRMLKRVVGHPKKQEQAYIDRSPAHWAHEIDLPIYIVHGTNDTQVDISHARKLAGALDQAGKPYTMALFNGLDHRFPRREDEKALDDVFAWLRATTQRT
ncbi:alpha/beta hydrolase family protein [Paenibacillus sp. GCM10023248]|uniref:alpha/beta hydrolase family protein n=1 Tax=unclassified Paenibacillus TaxID=185978 RepID=UPI002379F7F0|nr:prolyl oligopeptidase family serine peptidase [Paenibacillus sp. MAHUQ-63]MDD9271385.1 prolyl oligopeptidase family serine peptidase [Paenibacillus sp. MAHUQ-63]